MMVSMSSLPRVEVSTTTVPANLGRYEVLEPLGSGGMAVVYRAWDPLLQIHRAIKVLHEEAVSHRTLRKRFMTEASTLTRLVHPNVLRIYEVGEDDGRCWYAMDLIEEGTLQRRLEREGPLPATEALHITFQVLQALGSAHKAQIVHRDIKPHNILLRGDGTALLADFGSARQEAVMDLTRTGDVLGTIGYMAPEHRADARGAGPAADIYAVGATLFGLVTGRPPLGLFEGEIDALFLARLHSEVREVLRSATRYRPEHRYPTARHMALEVARAYDRIVGLSGSEAARQRWMARFDLLMDTAGLTSSPPGMLEPIHAAELDRVVAPQRAFDGTGRPVEREISTPAPKRRKTVEAPAPSAFASMWASARGAVSSLFASPAPNPPAGPIGVWEGRIADLLPVRIEVEATRDGRFGGWVVTTGMRGPVVTRLEGTWSADRATLDLTEVTERPDRGRYMALLRNGALEGRFQSAEPGARALPFTLTRAKDAPSGQGRE